MRVKFQAPLLAAIAGYVDTLGFVALFGLFTVHVTGNFILIGAEVAGKGSGIALKLAAFPAFVAGVAFAKLIAVMLSGLPRATLERTLLALQAAFLCVFLAAGLAALPITSSDSSHVMLCGVCGAFAMAIQNALPRLVATPGVPTTVMTGNVTQAVLDMIHVFIERDPIQRATVRARIAATLTPVGGFAIGSIAGALAFASLSFWALAVPVVLLVGLAFSVPATAAQA